jgi:protein LTV1
MGKKKSFIDKKTAVTFNLVSKTHDDPTGFGQNDVRAWPDETESSRAPSIIDEEQLNCGVYFDDGYDYLQHIREREFASYSMMENPKSNNARWDKATLDGQFDDAESAISGMTGRLHAIDMGEGKNYNAMKATAAEGPAVHCDPEIAQTLMDAFEDFDEDLEDDFIARAMQEPDQTPDSAGHDGISDWFAREDAHKRAHQQRSLRDHLDGDDDEYDTCSESSGSEGDGRETTKSERSRFTEYSMTSSAVPRNPYQSEVDDHFEHMFADYDDTEIGALDHENVTGHVGLNNEALMRVITALRPSDKPIDLPEDGVVLRECDVHSDSDREITEEDIFGKEKPKDKWDVDSILSTYSNIYNRPKIICSEKKLQLSKDGFPIDESDRTPIKYKLIDEDFDRIKYIPPNVRQRDETKEESRARQKIQREEKRLRRMEKKNNQIAFKIEEIKQRKIELNKNCSSGIKL